MSYNEKNNYVELFSTLAIFGYYFFDMRKLFEQGAFSGPDSSSLLGQKILWLLAAFIVIHVVVQILFAIGMAVITRDHKPSYVIDERDQLIELKGMRVGYFVLGGGFVACMVLLATGYDTALVFNLIVAAFALGSVGDNFTRIIMYRMGS